MKISRRPLLVIPALLLISNVGSAQLTPLEFCEEYRCPAPQVSVEYTLFDKYVCWNGTALTLKTGTSCPSSSVEYHLDLGEQNPASGVIEPLDITAGPQGNEFYCCGATSCEWRSICTAGEVLIYCFTGEAPVKQNGHWICEEV